MVNGYTTLDPVTGQDVLEFELPGQPRKAAVITNVILTTVAVTIGGLGYTNHIPYDASSTPDGTCILQTGISATSADCWDDEGFHINVTTPDRIATARLSDDRRAQNVADAPNSASIDLRVENANGTAQMSLSTHLPDKANAISQAQQIEHQADAGDVVAQQIEAAMNNGNCYHFDPPIEGQEGADRQVSCATLPPPAGTGQFTHMFNKSVIVGPDGQDQWQDLELGASHVEPDGSLSASLRFADTGATVDITVSHDTP